MIIIFVIVLSIVLGLAALELDTCAVLGLPFLRRKDVETVRKLLPDASLNPHCKDILGFFPKNGYISELPYSPCGGLYFTDYKRHIRIPWWTPLYREVKAKYAELNRQEK